MRFHQLPNGALFEYQGKTYVKTGPLTAAEHPGGGQRCIPRSALVGQPDARPGSAGGVDGAAPQALGPALDAFCATVTEMIEELCAEDPERRGYCKGRLDQARRQLLEALDKSS